jgi:hypothetical protein
MDDAALIAAIPQSSLADSTALAAEGRATRSRRKVKCDWEASTPARLLRNQSCA